MRHILVIAYLLTCTYTPFHASDDITWGIALSPTTSLDQARLLIAKHKPAYLSVPWQHTETEFVGRIKETCANYGLPCALILAFEYVTLKEVAATFAACNMNYIISTTIPAVKEVKKMQTMLRCMKEKLPPSSTLLCTIGATEAPLIPAITQTPIDGVYLTEPTQDMIRTINTHVEKRNTEFLVVALTNKETMHNARETCDGAHIIMHRDSEMLKLMDQKRSTARPKL